jgi:hypothetical protein
MLTFQIFNSTEFSVFLRGGNASFAYSTGSNSAARIVFPAPYTDTFFLVWENHYPPSSRLTLAFFVETSYQTNVVIG